jgi:diamine N-acetyltransferase
MGIVDRSGRAVTVRAVDEHNWRAVADVAPRDDQREFVAALAARYVLLSDREGVWTSLAICADDHVVGHVMWAVDDEENTYVIGGLVIDAAEQGRGLGRAAMLVMLTYLDQKAERLPVRLAVDPANQTAERLYSSLGFVATGELDGDESIMELR